jgi:hypothetical protein
MKMLAGSLCALLIAFQPAAASEADDRLKARDEANPAYQWRKVCLDEGLPNKIGQHKQEQQTSVKKKSKLPVCYTYADIAFEDLIVGQFGILEVPTREKLFIIAGLHDYLSPDPGYIQIDGGPPIELIRGACDIESAFRKRKLGPASSSN